LRFGVQSLSYFAHKRRRINSLDQYQVNRLAAELSWFGSGTAAEFGWLSGVAFRDIFILNNN